MIFVFPVWWVDKVRIRSFGFFDDVSIEEIDYSYVSNYDVLYFSTTADFYRYYETDTVIDSNTFEVSEWSDAIDDEILIGSGDDLWFRIYRHHASEYKEVSDEHINAVLDSIVTLGEYHSIK